MLRLRFDKFLKIRNLLKLMTKRIVQLALTALLLIIASDSLRAQFQLELMRQGFYDAHVNVDKYPVFSAFVRATENGNPAVLTTREILVIEDNRSVYPSFVGKPDAQNWQRIEWTTSLLSKTDTANGDIDKLQLFVVFNNNMQFIDAEYRLPSVSIVSFLDYSDNKTNELIFGNVIPGNSETAGFKIWPQSARMVNGKEQQIPVDSIRLISDEFRYFDLYGPPFMLTSPILHDAYIIFRPKDNQYKRNKIEVYYDGGRKSILHLKGNSFPINKTTFLNVIKPNGGEKLTPCEEYEIKWKGNVSGLNTKIEYSTDNGLSWKEIAYVADSTYMWTVPGDVTDKALIRVSQPLQKDKQNNLLVDNIHVTKCAFDSKSKFLLAANQAGIIYEWNLRSLMVDNQYSIGNVRYPGEISESKGLFYYDNDKKFVAAYNRYYFYPADNPDTLAFFDVGKADPVMLVPANTIVKEIVPDFRRNLLAIVPKYDNKLYVHSLSDGSVKNVVSFPYPIATANFSKNSDSAIVVLYNNDIYILSVPDFKVLSTVNYSDYPQIIKAAISPNGKFIGVGLKLPERQEFTGNRNYVHLIDIQSGMIVRSLGIAASNPVEIDFSPTSNILIGGNQGQPQIAFWDLPSNDYSGSIPGNTALLTDMKVSPDGNTVATASKSNDYLTIKAFTYPEFDLSDTTFSILRAKVTVDSVLVQPKYIGTDNELTASGKICNKGEVPIIIDNAQFYFAKHFKLKSKIQNDTLYPGECLDFEYVCHPIDTGRVRDTLLFYSCSGTFKIPFEVYSKARNITFFSKPFQFGELCVGEQQQKEFVFARNEDPVPIKVNYITVADPYGNPFSIVNSIRDSVIAPGGIFNVTILFSPQKTGPVTSGLLVRHSDLSAYDFEGSVTGIGLGTDIQLSHQDLRFIPEILTRKISIKNLSDNDISLVEAEIYPEKNFVCLTPLPLEIKARAEAEIEIQWNGRNDADDTLHLIAEPCVKRTVVVLGPYEAQSYLSIPDVSADPNGKASIPVKFNTYSNYLYRGSRFFESEISVNPRMFLPESVTSSYGQGRITRNEIINDRRIIGFRIDGDFPESGIVGEINGVAGLAETDTSALRILPATINWGKAVQTNWGDGTLRLINLCNDRRIIQQGGVLSEMRINPNPVGEKLFIYFESQAEGNGIIDIINCYGTKAMTVTNIRITKGLNTLTINTEDLQPGAYTVIIRLGGEFISQQIIVVR
jgi:hypothetical protein